MTPQDFKAWRKRRGLTQAQAGEILGRTQRTIVALEQGDENQPIHESIELACEALDTRTTLNAVRPAVLMLRSRAASDIERETFDQILEAAPAARVQLKVSFHPSGNRTLMERAAGEKMYRDLRDRYLFANKDEASFYRATAQKLGELARRGIAVSFEDAAD